MIKIGDRRKKKTHHATFNESFNSMRLIVLLQRVSRLTAANLNLILF